MPADARSVSLVPELKPAHVSSSVCPLVNRSAGSFISVKAEGTLETQHGSILVRNPDMLRNRSCGCNEAVKGHFDEVLRGSIPTPKREIEGPCTQNQLTKCQTNHCFLAFSEYIAPQRVRCARSFWPGFLFGGESAPSNSKLLEARSGEVGPGFPVRSRVQHARPEEEP